MGFKLKVRPHRHKTEKYLEKLQSKEYFKVVESCAKDGVKALSDATPKDTGKTAASWSYEIEKSSNGVTIYWTNDNVTRDGEPIAVLIQYGHGTGTGGYVVGRDYINPAMRPVFDEIVDKLEEALVKL